MLFSQCHLGVDHRIDLFLRNDHFLAELNSHDLIFFATITINGDEVAKYFSATHVLLVDDADTVNGFAIITDGDTALLNCHTNLTYNQPHPWSMKSRFPKYTVIFPFGVVFLKTFTLTTIFDAFWLLHRIRTKITIDRKSHEFQIFFVEMKNTFINRFKISAGKFWVEYCRRESAWQNNQKCSELAVPSFALYTSGHYAHLRLQFYRLATLIELLFKRFVKKLMRLAF